MQTGINEHYFYENHADFAYHNSIVTIGNIGENIGEEEETRIFRYDSFFIRYWLWTSGSNMSL